MRTYASSRVKRKRLYRKSELQMCLLIPGGHIGAPKDLRLGNRLYISLLQRFIFLASSTGQFLIYFFYCVTVKTIYTEGVLFCQKWYKKG